MKKFDINIFTRRLKEARNENNLTMEALALKMNLTIATISRYESGDIYPPLDRLFELAVVLNISLDYLIGLTDI